MSPNDEYKLVPVHPVEKENPFSLIYERSRVVLQNKFLIRKLVRTSILTAYKRSFIGLSWLVITPLLSVIIWVFLHSAGIMEPGETGIPYPAYVLLSTSIWSFFAGAYQVSSLAFLQNGPLMASLNFPHEVVIVEKVLVHLVNFMIPFGLNIVVLLLYGVKFSLISLLFPLALIPLFLLGVGLGILVSLMRVVAVDFAKMVDQGIGFLMFLTPVIYAPNVGMPELSLIINYNPLTYLVGFPRDILTQSDLAGYYPFLLCASGAILFFLFSFWFFSKNEKQLLERIINV